jgi:thioredoxin-like negative regulator of GroEL
MVFHQAALATDPGNALAANELAVLLVRRGRYEAARELLERSVPISTR